MYLNRELESITDYQWTIIEYLRKTNVI